MGNKRKDLNGFKKSCFVEAPLVKIRLCEMGKTEVKVAQNPLSKFSPNFAKCFILAYGDKS